MAGSIRRTRRLCSTQIELRPCTECLCSSVYLAFPVFYLLCHCMEGGMEAFSVLLFLAQKVLYWFLLIELYQIALNEPISFSYPIESPTTYRNTHRIIVKMNCYTPNVCLCLKYANKWTSVFTTAGGALLIQARRPPASANGPLCKTRRRHW